MATTAYRFSDGHVEAEFVEVREKDDADLLIVSSSCFPVFLSHFSLSPPPAAFNSSQFFLDMRTLRALDDSQLAELVELCLRFLSAADASTLIGSC
eukprot:2588903-Rhodomonas_salina.1